MSNLSYTKEFFLLAVTNKGKIPVFKSAKVYSCLIAGGMTELYTKGMISKNEEDEFVSNNRFDESNVHLFPLYEIIKSADKPINMREIAESYYKLCSGKKLAQLEESFRDMLVSKNAKMEIKTGFFRSKTGFAPKPEKIEEITRKIHTQFFGFETLSTDTICLVDLLCKSTLAQKHFSKDDVKRLKTRLEELSAAGAYAAEKQLLDHAFDTVEELIEEMAWDDDDDFTDFVVIGLATGLF